ncbi:hypothetical protein AB4539_08045 [Vibrio splendidus]
MLSSIAIFLSGIWWCKEGGFEPVIVFITGISALLFSVQQVLPKPQKKMNVDSVTLNDLYRRIINVEDTINKSFLDRRLWNELQERLGDLSRYYHEHKVNFSESLDEKVLEVIRVGHCIMRGENNHPIPTELADAYKASKERVVAEIREFKSAENKI